VVTNKKALNRDNVFIRAVPLQKEIKVTAFPAYCPIDGKDPFPLGNIRFNQNLSHIFDRFYHLHDHADEMCFVLRPALEEKAVHAPMNL
jgi:hypothetical protein